MTDQQLEFLKLAVVKQMKYREIASILGVKDGELSQWWDELKSEREELSEVRTIWRQKFKVTTDEESFWKFKDWYDKACLDKRCHYCGITEFEIEKLAEKAYSENKPLTKRNRGKRLEIDRKEPHESYDVINNLVFSCYWCNNAKTDTFSEDEFLKIGEVINSIWKERLK